jgi:hypothetical protein
LVARGDIGGALNKISSAADSLQGHSKHFNMVDAVLPFGRQGIKNFIRLFIGSAKDLYDAINEEPKDPVKIALAAGQLGLDVAGVVPGLNSITGPLKMVLGTATVIKGAADLIGDLREFQQGLMGM